MGFDELEKQIADNQTSINRLLSALKNLKQQQEENINKLNNEISESLQKQDKQLSDNHQTLLDTAKEGINDIKNKVEKVLANAPKDGEDGKDGKDGYTPIKGKDYFDGKDGYTPIKGKDYFDGKDGKNGKDAKEVVLEIGKVEAVDGDAKARIRKDGDITYLDLKIPRGPQGYMGFDGKNGKDATINGINEVLLEAGENINIVQDGNKLILNAKGAEVDLTGYATEKWVKDQDYIPISDFLEYINYFYYDTNEIDELLDDFYLKEEIDAMLEELPTGETELTGGDNTVIEDKAINVYTNTGYKISDKDIKLQQILDGGTTGTNKMVYTLDEVIIIYDGTNKIRRSENGIDFEIVTLACNCSHLAYNESNKRIYGTDNVSNFFYSNDNGLTWTLIKNDRANNITNMDIGYGAGFRTIYRSTKEIISWSFQNNALSQNTRISSTIYPDFIAMVNDSQYVWCNSSGTFKYGAGSREENFASLSGITINLLKRVNDITMIGLKNRDKMYILEPATSITAYKWVECSLPDTCTVNDITFNPYDETYYLLTDINTYYKTKDFIEFESVDKGGLRGKQGYFTLMGIQATTTDKNKLLLAPTRTTLENKAQEWDRILDKARWVGDGLELVGEKFNVKARSPLVSNSYGVGIGVLEEHNLPDFVIEGVYVARAEAKDLFDPYEIENWYFSGEAYPEEQYKAVKFLFNQAGSFYNQVTWEEYFVEQYEYGYLFYDQNMNIFKYVKLGNKSWMFE